LPAGALAYIAEATGNRVARVDEEIAASPAVDEVAAALGVDPGSPVLVTRARHYTADSELIEYAETTTVAGHWHARTYAITGN
jgi:DNA-binding GntR family transcriptional regulator